MQASEIRFEEFLSQPKTNFIIPVYQRNYDWQEQHCIDFLNDIETLAKKEKDSHFLGSIVYIKSDDIEAIELGMKEYIVIDGQQRITTTMLFLKAIYDLSQDEWDKEDILENFLVNKTRGGNKLKLKPIKNDNTIFQELIKNSDTTSSQDSRIIINYNFFKDHIKDSTIKINDYFRAFRRIWIVYIGLDRDKDDPQLIFESINSTGLSLSEADLIRNFILMDKKQSDQIYLFEEYWTKIEQILGSEKISSFIRDYLTMKESKIPKQNDIYLSFKRYIQKAQINVEDFLKDLLYYADIYAKFLYLNYENRGINQIIKELKELKVTVAFPYLLSLFSDYRQNIIDENILLKSILLIRNYVFRRSLCEYNTNGLNKVFQALHREHISIDKYKEDYYGYLAGILLDKRGTAIFPRDDEFEQYFTHKDIYKFKNKNYLLYALESNKNKELVSFSELTIEHIMPQKLTTKWNLELGDKYSETHDKYLHNIGNLTLSGYNSTLSNKTFHDKKEILTSSGIRLNSYFLDIEQWNKDEIEKRAKKLFHDIALNIWKIPISSETISANTAKLDFYSLDDDFEAKGTKIKKIIVLGKTIITSSWIQCFTEFSKVLYHKNNLLFNSFLTDDDFQGLKQRIITSNPDECRRATKVFEEKEIYLECNLGANSLLNYIKLFAEKFELEGDDVIFYIN